MSSVNFQYQAVHLMNLTYESLKLLLEGKLIWLDTETHCNYKPSLVFHPGLSDSGHKDLFAL